MVTFGDHLPVLQSAARLTVPRQAHHVLFFTSLKAGGEGDDRGRDGWMASLTQWT